MPYKTPTTRRTTVPVTGTLRSAPCHLDHEADVALAYAAEWHRRAGDLKLPTSGLIRRALAVYAEFLESVQAPVLEFNAAKHASEARELPEDDRQLSALRLASVPPEEPLPAFQQVLVGQPELARRKAFHEGLADRVDQMVASMRPRKLALAA